uniref:Uncharacterized protein n=1 Tax=Anguilla anguilla TaxID=7936 RepID=A0A0E9R9C3_ANGAN
MLFHVDSLFWFPSHHPDIQLNEHSFATIHTIV